MQIAARTAAWAKSGYTAKDYVQDSAFVFWDGIENAGLGLPHDPLATQIADLSGNGNNLPNTNMTIGGSSFTLDGSSAQVDVPEKQYDQMTIEVLLDIVTRKEINALWFARSTSAHGVLFQNGSPASTLRSYYMPWASLGLFENPSIGKRLITFKWNNGEQKLYFDSELVATGSNMIATGFNTLTRLFLNNYNGSSSGALLTFSRVTLHDAYLTDEQIAANYAIDKARFGLPDITT